MNSKYSMDIIMIDDMNEYIKELSFFPSMEDGGYTIHNTIPTITKKIKLFFMDSKEGNKKIVECGQRVRCIIFFEDNTKMEIIINVKPSIDCYVLFLPKNIVTKHLICQLNIDDELYKEKIFKNDDIEEFIYFENFKDNKMLKPEFKSFSY